jgi:hypothetical protein
MLAVWLLALPLYGLGARAQDSSAQAQPSEETKAVAAARAAALPPRVREAERFLAQRGWTRQGGILARTKALRKSGAAQSRHASASPSVTGSTWSALGPTAVSTSSFGLVSGRVSSIAFDPSDATGNVVYIGTTGGGVWKAANAGSSSTSSIVFSALTDSLSALGGAIDASISIGAVAVQPGGTGVILAGTGDPNDVLDSYYGAGILRSTDGGNSWTLIQESSDIKDGLSGQDFSFVGEGFAGIAFSGTTPSLVVAAVSEAYEGGLVGAPRSSSSVEGLYYSTDSGASWHLSTIEDGSSSIVQGPLITSGDVGNAGTAVVWNQARQLFIAAVRYHGYYQSSDGATWTRLTNQPGANLASSAGYCPTNKGKTGSIACPIYRGALAVNPTTGDTFAWTVDLNNKDQGLWQDLCNKASGGGCGNSSISFSTQRSTTALESSAATIADGNYNLTLAAVASGSDTLLFAGAHDLWKCGPLTTSGCTWRNTTNTTTCMGAEVGEFQHALAWNASNSSEIFIGNDSGLWRSTDAVGESGSACSSSDANHFQNLNGTLGSLAEVVSLSPILTSPYVMMAGVGVNGTAGVKASDVTTDWPQILTGYGGSVAIDASNVNDWYVNDQAGVAIYRCSSTANCSTSDFGVSPVVNDADVSYDGDDMAVPAPFLVDPLDDSQLLIGTCRIWRGPASGSWSTSDAISEIFDIDATTFPCNGDGLIRTLAVLKLSSTTERIYVGMYGSASYGGNAAGHVFSATYDSSSSTAPSWTDLTLHTVANDSQALNYYGFDISGIAIDSHDSTGQTVYVTVAGIKNPLEDVRTVYRSTNGGATWTDITANLPAAPANAVVVDPQNASVVYVATDVGVYYTTNVSNCTLTGAVCWAVFGAGLPEAPVVALSAAPATASAQVLAAATYGRGIWQTALWSANSGSSLATASVNPTSLTFSDQAYDSTSAAQTVTVTNTGSVALTISTISISGDFGESDNCAGKTIAAGGSCTLSVTFTPQAVGARTGEMTINANVYGGQLTVDLSGNSTLASKFTLNPSTLNFGGVEINNATAAVASELSVTVANGGSSAVTITSISIAAPFSVASNSCGSAGSSIAAGNDCALTIEFAPTAAGAVTGYLTYVDSAGTQAVKLTGTGLAASTDTLSTNVLIFPATAVGLLSSAQTVTITNSGGERQTGIAISISGEFQQSNTCGTQLTAGATCAISVVFAPTDIGALTGTVTIAAYGQQTQTVSLSGSGIAAGHLSVSPTSMTFSNQTVGVASVAQTLTVTNGGGSPIANVGFALMGGAASNYTVTPSVCATLLASGASCTAQVVFTPSASGLNTATLVVSSSTSNVTAVSVPLNGSAPSTSKLSASPSSLSFFATAVGVASVAQVVTITNSGSTTLATPSFVIASPFSISSNSCVSSLAAGGNCTIAIVFTPTSTSAVAGVLTASSGSLSSTVTLTGSVFDFTIAFSGSSSQSVVRGQSANYTLVLTPEGTSATFAYVCGTLPTDALCTFSPPSGGETLSSGNSGNVVVTISTTAASSRLEPLPFWRALPVFCGLLLLPLALRRRRKIFLSVLLLVILAAGVSSCMKAGLSKNGSSGSGGGSGTPVGSYTIPVTVTANNISHAVNLSLTVD